MKTEKVRKIADEIFDSWDIRNHITATEKAIGDIKSAIEEAYYRGIEDNEKTYYTGLKNEE